MEIKEIIGREAEKALLDDVLASDEAELMAVYGRRRVGKTYLIKAYLREQISFHYSGVHGVETEQQLVEFTTAVSEQLNQQVALEQPADWFRAFAMLAQLLKKQMRKKKVIIFLDEFPWMQTPKSNFLAAFENFWNTWAADKPNVVVILCGSSASWMIQKVVHNRGGLHNRITRKMPLAPFSLQEAEAFLKKKKVQLNRYELVQLYMAMGGIPQYLKQVKPGMSAAQIIDDVCFSSNGFLRTEFDHLFQALFDSSERHIKVVRALANKPMGLNRNELIKACQLASGGSTSNMLEELSASGFITPYVPFGRQANDVIYKLTDEYIRFYFKFIERNKVAGKSIWLKLAQTPSWKSWSGFAFETICLKHVDAIKHALKIAGIYSENAIWKGKTGASTEANQIDLVINRHDNCITLCEMKFYKEPFVIDKKYAAILRQKMSQFVQQTKTRKQLFWTLVSVYGLHKNEHSIGLVDHSITIDDLFHQTHF